MIQVNAVEIIKLNTVSEQLKEGDQNLEKLC